MICLIYGEERFLMEQKLASLKKEYRKIFSREDTIIKKKKKLENFCFSW